MTIEPAPLPTPERTPEERQAQLANEVSLMVRSGYRVESQTANQAILVKGRRPAHLLHFFLSVFTLGLWALFVWLPLSVFGGEKRRVLTVDAYGNVATTKGRG